MSSTPSGRHGCRNTIMGFGIFAVVLAIVVGALEDSFLWSAALLLAAAVLGMVLTPVVFFAFRRRTAASADNRDGSAVPLHS